MRGTLFHLDRHLSLISLLYDSLSITCHYKNPVSPKHIVRIGQDTFTIDQDPFVAVFANHCNANPYMYPCYDAFAPGKGGTTEIYWKV